ncbi:ATP-binding cassette domain-containing protein [Aerococcus viridans]
MSGVVNIQNLTVKNNELIILNDISCEWLFGEFILLAGDSGSGKSTFMHTIAGFNGASFQGNVVMDGQRMSDYTIPEKAQKIGLMFQNPGQQFTMRTLERELYFVLENCGIPYNLAKERIREAVDEVGIAYLLHQDLMTLSGGEKQRAALTILIAVDAPILLLDEPFASIDPASRIFLMDMLGKLRDKGKLIVIVDHDMSHYRPLVDRFLMMKNGCLTEVDVTHLPEEIPIPLLKSNNGSESSMFTLDHIRIKQGDKTLLNQEAFIFQKGVTTLTGNNGAGKSTLLKSMAQLYPYKGRMCFQDKWLSKFVSKKRLYESLTLAVQDASQQFVTLDVRDEITFPKQKNSEINARQLQAFEDLNITHILDRSLFHLSEGQKKMVQLIALLGLDHQFLMLDEPFSGLDQKSCDYFARWILEKKNQTDFLIVSHRLAPLEGISDYHIHLSKKLLEEV